MTTTGNESQWRGNISQPEYDIAEERDVYVSMRDGVQLAVNVFRPDSEGEFPALLAMAGYGKETQDLSMPPQPLQKSAVWDGTIEAGDPEELASRGYVHVVADVRGTGHSEGEFTGMKMPQEGEDGHDLIEWIADQPWCNGHVGMTGYSYFSWTTLKTAIEQPPHLDAIFVSHAASDFYRDGGYPGGVLNLFYYGLWDGRNGSSGFAPKNPVSYMKKTLSEEEFERRRRERMEDPDIEHQPNLYHLLNYPYVNPQFFDMLMNPYDGEFWRQRSVYPYFDQIDTPIHIVGKSPHSLTAYWDLYEGIDAPKKLLVKPPGPEERPWREDVEQLIRWFDHWLKGNDTGIMDESGIDLFVSGTNEWRQEDEWPLPEIEWVECYLRRWGWLSFEPERHQPEPDAFLQQPLHVSDEKGSVEYVSPPVPGNLTAIGPASLTFFASIDQDDTAWMVSLYDVAPDGSESRIDKSYLKASHRALDPDRSERGRPYHLHTEEACEPVEPGEVYEYNLSLGPLTRVFTQGHRIKLLIESMESPRDEEMHIHYHPHVPTSKTTLHKIYRDDEHRSHLLLPTISPDQEVLDLLGDDSYLGGSH